MARKVLIVEDESNIAELVNLYLKKEGYDKIYILKGGFSSWTGKVKSEL